MFGLVLMLAPTAHAACDAECWIARSEADPWGLEALRDIERSLDVSEARSDLLSQRHAAIVLLALFNTDSAWAMSNGPSARRRAQGRILAVEQPFLDEAEWTFLPLATLRDVGTSSVPVDEKLAEEMKSGIANRLQYLSVAESDSEPEDVRRAAAMRAASDLIHGDQILARLALLQLSRYWGSCSMKELFARHGMFTAVGGEPVRLHEDILAVAATWFAFNGVWSWDSSFPSDNVDFSRRAAEWELAGGGPHDTTSWSVNSLSVAALDPSDARNPMWSWPVVGRSPCELRTFTANFGPESLWWSSATRDARRHVARLIDGAVQVEECHAP